MTQTLRIAAIQLVSQMGERAIERNFSVVEGLVQQAKANDAHVAVLPENVLTFGQKQAYDHQQQTDWLEGFAALAREMSLWLVAGSLPLQRFTINAKGELRSLCWEGSGLPYATSVVFNSHGAIAGVYHKVHLFDAQVNDTHGNYRESDFFQAGRTVTVVPTPWGNMGIGICFDLRFPRYFQFLRDHAADFVVLPSAFTYITGKAHWEILLRARAIENQFAIVGANQGGDHGLERKTWGDSMIVDAWGDVVARAGEASLANDSQLGEHLVLAELNLSKQREIRERMALHSGLCAVENPRG